MEKIIKAIEQYFNKEPPFFPVILHYQDFTSLIFDCISIIEYNFRQIHKVYRTSTFFLEFDEKSISPSYYQNLFNKLKKVDFDFEIMNKMVIIDSFFPIDIKYNINNPEFSDFIINFCNESNTVNFFNTKLILGMTTNQMRQIPRNTNLRRYRGKEYKLNPVNSDETSKSLKNLKFDMKLFPTGNLTSIFHNNPLYWFIEKQLLNLEGVDFSNFNDALINLVKQFTSINLTHFKSMFKEIDEKSQIGHKELTKIIDNPESRDFESVKVYNIFNTIRYLHKCKDKINIEIPQIILNLLTK